eukprot:scpid102327/ scgid20815/ 
MCMVFLYFKRNCLSSGISVMCFPTASHAECSPWLPGAIQLPIFTAMNLEGPISTAMNLEGPLSRRYLQLWIWREHWATKLAPAAAPSYQVIPIQSVWAEWRCTSLTCSAKQCFRATGLVAYCGCSTAVSSDGRNHCSGRVWSG